jgi:hypothetical protein
MTSKRYHSILMWILAVIFTMLFYLIFTLLNHETLFKNYKTMIMSFILSVSGVFFDRFILRKIEKPKNK